MRILILAIIGVLAAACSARAHAADSVGPESCKVCHSAAYEIWKSSPHARATESLTPAQKKDGRCISCHSPEQTKGVAQVHCETCHGGGQFYTPSYVMKDAELSRAVGMTNPSEKMCQKCHNANAPSVKPFNFNEKLKQIDHWSAAKTAGKDKPEKSPAVPAKAENAPASKKSK